VLLKKNLCAFCHSSQTSFFVFSLCSSPYKTSFSSDISVRSECALLRAQALWFVNRLLFLQSFFLLPFWRLFFFSTCLVPFPFENMLVLVIPFSSPTPPPQRPTPPPPPPTLPQAPPHTPPPPHPLSDTDPFSLEMAVRSFSFLFVFDRRQFSVT